MVRLTTNSSVFLHKGVPAGKATKDHRRVNTKTTIELLLNNMRGNEAFHQLSDGIVFRCVLVVKNDFTKIKKQQYRNNCAYYKKQTKPGIPGGKGLVALK